LKLAPPYLGLNAVDEARLRELHDEPEVRGLHSSASQLNVGTFRGIHLVPSVDRYVITRHKLDTKRPGDQNGSGRGEKWMGVPPLPGAGLELEVGARLGVAPQVELRAKFEGDSSHYSFNRLVPGAFNMCFIGSTCTAIPWGSWPRTPTGSRCEGRMNRTRRVRGKRGSHVERERETRQHA
jgi:hypothetical protein